MAQEIASLLTGLTNGITKYLDIGNQNTLEDAQNQRKSQQQLQLKTAESALDVNKGEQIEKYKNNLEDVLTPEMAEKALPGYGAKMVSDYNSARPNNPLKLKEGVSFLKNATDTLDKKSEKQQKSDDVRLTQYARSLQSDKEFTTIRTTRDNIEKTGALLDQVESQPEGADRRQMYENAVSQMRVLAQNGAISEREIEHLLPDTFRGKVAQGLEFFLNHPEGTEAQAFVKRARDFFHRESDTTNTQLARRLNELSAPYKPILERNQGAASETFSTYGVNHHQYNPKIDKRTEPRKGFTPPAEDPLGLFK